MDVTTIENACSFCGESLTEPTEPYVVRTSFGKMSAFHVRCREIFNGYLSMRAAHAGYCHLDGCTEGPKNPFQST